MLTSQAALFRCWVETGFPSGVVLLLALFPANVHMALSPELFPDTSAFALYARLPFQALFIAWAYWATRPEVQESAG